VRLRALGAGGACVTALGVACAFAAPAVTTTACTTHQCDSLWVNIDDNTGGFVGDVQPLGDGTFFWESSPMNGTWIDYPGMRTYFFTLPGNFEPLQPPVAYVATGANPDSPDGGDGSSYVLASGQLAEMGGYGQYGFNITNSTCAEYYLYVYVVGRFPPAPAADDAGTGD
jgi:hypothetical protein